MGPMPYGIPSGYARVGRITEAVVDANVAYLTVTCDTGDTALLTFEIIDRSVWRWSMLPYGVMQPHATTIVSRKRELNHPVSLGQAGGSYVLTGGDLTLTLSADPWSFSFTDKSGNEVVRDNPGDVDGLGRPFVPPLGFVRDQTGVQRIFFTLHLDADEHLFGTGEKFTRVDKVGQRIISWTQDAFGSTSDG